MLILDMAPRCTVTVSRWISGDSTQQFLPSCHPIPFLLFQIALILALAQLRLCCHGTLRSMWPHAPMIRPTICCTPGNRLNASFAEEPSDLRSLTRYGKNATNGASLKHSPGCTNAPLTHAPQSINSPLRVQISGGNNKGKGPASSSPLTSPAHPPKRSATPTRVIEKTHHTTHETVIRELQPQARHNSPLPPSTAVFL